MKIEILVVDDEKNIHALFEQILTATGAIDFGPTTSVRVRSAFSAEEAEGMILQRPPDLIISDLALGRMTGLELLKKAKGRHPDVPFIMLTGAGTVEDAVKAMKDGAYDYLTKPFQHDELLLTVRKALEYRRLNDEIQRLREQLDERETVDFHHIIGQSRPLLRIFDMIRTVSKSDSTVLIEGESGTGKELVARSIHQESGRHVRPFVAINCGAIPETLLESELFGHVRGAFTGAVGDKDGLFQEAHGGTLFLDEISTISLPVQAKLLRAIQEKEIRPVGSVQGRKVDVRIVAATNRPLPEMIRKQEFRDDLYYRLAVITIHVPPLRDRKEDIPLLAQFFLDKYSRKNGRKFRKISDASLRRMLEYPWPGNIRELENIIERAVVIAGSDGDEMDLGVLPEALNPLDRTESRTATAVAREETGHRLAEMLQDNMDLKTILSVTTRDIEKFAITQILKEVRGNRTEAARRLGISRPSLYNKLREYNIT